MIPMPMSEHEEAICQNCQKLAVVNSVYKDAIDKRVLELRELIFVVTRECLASIKDTRLMLWGMWVILYCLLKQEHVPTQIHF
jgi:hypothetical protein